MASYEAKFRKFVVGKIHSGMSITDASKFFEMSRDTINRWLKWEKKGELERVRPTRYRSRLFTDEEFLEYIEVNNDSTLREIADHFNCSIKAIFTRLKALNITRKKKQRFTPNEMKNSAKNL